MGNIATNEWLTTVIASGGDAGGAPSFTIEEMMKALTLPVIVVLVLLGIMLLWCVYVAMERILFLRRSRLESIELNQALAPHFKAGDGHAALRAARQMAVKISYVQIPTSHADKADKIRETWSEYGSLPSAYLKDISAQLPTPATVESLGSFSPLDVADPAADDSSSSEADADDAALTQKTIDFVKGVPGLLEDLVAADGEGVLGQVYKNDSGLFVVSIDKTKKLYGKSYLAHILIPALQEWNENPDRDGIHAAERAIDTVLVTEGESLRTGLNILATTGSTAPFVGLVGTVFGIINAFREMSSGEAGLKELAPAIGEALVTTAIGIIVAIVGVWLFNYFTAKIESITNKMGTTAQVFMDWCEKRIIAEKKNNS